LSKHEKFNFNNLDVLKNKAKELGVSIPLSEDLSVLRQPIQINGKTCQNRLAILPMEGCDSELDGSPS